MKKFIYIAIVFILASFVMVEYKQKTKSLSNTTTVFQEKNSNKYNCLFLSYIDYAPLFKNKAKEEIEENIDEIISNLKANHFNTLIIQVRSFSDAIYKSNIFPTSSTVVEKEGEELPIDILDCLVKKAHKSDIKIFAWINPYRIRNTADISTITKNNPAYKWLDTNHISIIEEKGIFYNPASIEVQNLIIDGILEVVKYNVDGILFDDYFYPNDNIDEENYKEYVRESGNIEKEEYHLMIVNNLIKRVYESIKKENKSILFGISPEGNIENNYTRNYADVKTWVKEEGYIDFIMPQIYYGFSNTIAPFEETVDSWNEIITNDVLLIPALALYKAGEVDRYAKEGNNEWIENNDILKRQIEYTRKISKYNGFSIYRYDYFFNPKAYNDNVINEVKNIKSIVK